MRYASASTTLLFSAIVSVSLVACTSSEKVSVDASTAQALKLYWFIPDGMRAEPNLFNIYQWAQEGKLPNIKRMMERGSYGYAKPVFPGHTPTNFATLLTGTYPLKHGIADGPMHIEGKPLDKVAVGGFNSAAKRVAPIWSVLEDTGEKVALLSIPGSTPPELDNGITFRGRWGGWGADYHAVNFEQKTPDNAQRILQGRGVRLFFFGPELTQYIETAEPTGWTEQVTFSPAREVKLTAWGGTMYGLIVDTTDDNVINYDRVLFSMDKQRVFASVSEGQWAEWEPMTLAFTQGDQVQPVNTSVKVHIIKLEADGFFRLRLFYNNLNSFNTKPPSAAETLLSKTGPMVDFVDNFPPQLIFYPEDKKTFLDESNLSLQWHKKAVKSLLSSFSPSVVLHDIYTPNQMLTSRWWMFGLDPASDHYDTIDAAEREELWSEVQDMYRGLDAILGEALDSAGEDTYIVLSSDHGAIPLDHSVRLNNLFAKEGLLKFTLNPTTGEPVIDWAHSQAIYLKMDNIYLNPNGLAGNYHRASGPAYEQLRKRVITLLENLTDEHGVHPVSSVTTWEDIGTYADLPADRTGDLVVANRPGYGWNEEMTDSLEVFTIPLTSGYKQAVEPDNVPGMWVPFMIVGPKIKAGYYMGDAPTDLVDQFPTILQALGKEIPSMTDGKVLEEIFK